MNKASLICCGLAVVFALTAEIRVLAARPSSRSTTIYIKDLHCASCAKRVARKLYTVRGVVAVHADVKKNKVLVSPQKSNDVSPRALWEAVEAADLKPIKLLGPAGTFTSKPKS